MKFLDVFLDFMAIHVPS